MNFIVLQIKKKIVHPIYVCLIYIKDNGNKYYIQKKKIDINEKQSNIFKQLLEQLIKKNILKIS